MTPVLQSVPASLAAFFQGAAVSTVAPTGWIQVTGSDRVRWLNGMVTNSVQSLAPGQGAYSFLLNAQGRIQGDVTVWAQEDTLFLETSAEQTAPLMELLDRFIIMDDVELADRSTTQHGIRIMGPEAARIVAEITSVEAPGVNLRHFVPWQGQNLLVQALYSPLAPYFEFWTEENQTANDLLAALQSAGATHQTAEAFEVARILAGIPRYGTDIRDRDLPQETTQDRALHFNKGCYLGQEIVERIRSRGAVHRTFHAFQLQGTEPELPAALTVEDKNVGELTSAVSLAGTLYALGYIRREVLERDQTIAYPGGTAQAVVTPIRPL